jgi:hypothetical protein
VFPYLDSLVLLMDPKTDAAIGGSEVLYALCESRGQLDPLILRYASGVP